MDLRVPEQEKAFREEVRTFLEESLTPEIREAGKMVTSVFAPVKEAMAWQKILNDKGWAAPHWPKEHGGTGWSVTQRAIFAEELVRGRNPAAGAHGPAHVWPLPDRLWDRRTTEGIPAEDP